MQFLTEWISNIILLILLATILELLLPNSSLQRYVKMVVGLLLLVIILTPLFSIFSKDVDSWVSSIGLTNQIQEEALQNSVEFKKREIQRAQLAYISEQVAVQLKRQVEEELVHRFDKEVVDVHVYLDDFLQEEDYLNSISKVSIHLRGKKSEEENENGSIPTVALVSIDTSRQVEPVIETTVGKQEIIKYLATTWPVPQNKIEVFMEGGSVDQ
ncbi:stage III sporulation protein AF [Anaerobacillus alkaliphilus]|uniref:Stage III sporulation protein AF n=1 Tax=Anaerobacillus alkaliphilus TaxID=1548597 RepID=A0A4Q0VQT6_9BACI|nr:stage III sporulation protein AF [Anaerobacillus alkaliphilus]RXI99510.1 stage III sporulation protein AF [Anaerobacillus alkaliphilus]